MPCKLNHYCIDGLRYQCPASTPVTQGTGTDSLDGCLTCVQRNGNDGNPIYDDLVGDCVSCYEYDSSTPIWDGSKCTACSESTPVWNGTSCEACPDETPIWTGEDCIAAEYKVAYGDKTLYIVERATPTQYQDLAPQSAEEENAEFLEKYNIEYASAVYPDMWAGAMKYCQDKGLRMPTAEEMVAILEAALDMDIPCNDVTDCAFSISPEDLSGSEIEKFIFPDSFEANYYIRNLTGANYAERLYCFLTPSLDASTIYECNFQSSGPGIRNSESNNILCIK